MVKKTIKAVIFALLFFPTIAGATNLPFAIEDPATSETAEYLYQQIQSLNKIFNLQGTTLTITIGDQIAIKVGSGGYLEVSTISTSRIEIGISTPTDARFEILGTLTAPAEIITSSNTGGITSRVRNMSDAGYSIIEFFSSGNVDVGGVGYANPFTGSFADQMFFGTYISRPLVLIANNAERWRITPTGIIRPNQQSSSCDSLTPDQVGEQCTQNSATCPLAISTATTLGGFACVTLGTP